MNTNFFRTVYRVLIKRKLTSLIHILGLSLGISLALLIVLYVEHESSFDQMHAKKDRIYRLVYNYNQISETVRFPIAMKPFFNDVPGKIECVSIRPFPAMEVQYQENLFKESMAYVDSGFFHLFDFEILNGNPDEALKAPNSVMLSEHLAVKYFGDDNPMGQIIKIENAYDVTVNGIFKDMPGNSHIQLDMLVSMETLAVNEPFQVNSLDVSSALLYFLMEENANTDGILNRVEELYEKRFNKKVEGFYLQNLNDIHLHSSQIGVDINPYGNYKLVSMFKIIAILIVLIAIFNYVNLTTANIFTRIRESSIRKLLGAKRSHLILQQFGETFLLTFISVWLALILAEFLIPLINAHFSFDLDLVLSLKIFVQLFLLVIMISLAGGIYPALYLSSFRPVKSLSAKNDLLSGVTHSGGMNLKIRQVLVLIQFGISISLIICALVISRQNKFLLEKDLGYQTENILVFNNPWDAKMRSRFDIMVQKIEALPQVKSVAGAYNYPSEQLNNFCQIKDAENPDNKFSCGLVSVSEDFFSTIGAEIIQGRDFDSSSGRDSISGYIINETAARMLNFDQAVGKMVYGTYNRKEKNEIIGVVKDIHWSSKMEKIDPMMFYVSPSEYPPYVLNILVKANNEDFDLILPDIKEWMAELAPGWVIDYKFLDESTRAQYKSQLELELLLSIFTLAAIFISCLGLFGLSIFSVQNKKKQIGIRKVLGASFGMIFRLISKEFFYLFVLSLVPSIPLCYYLMNQWFQNYSYHIDFPWLMVMIGALAGLLIAGISILSVVLNTLRMNPIEVIQYE